MISWKRRFCPRRVTREDAFYRLILSQHLGCILFLNENRRNENENSGLFGICKRMSNSKTVSFVGSGLGTN